MTVSNNIGSRWLISMIAGKLPIHVLNFVLFFSVPIMVQSQNIFPINGRAGQGTAMPFKAIHIHSNFAKNTNDPTLLLTNGISPTNSGSYTFDQVQASFSLLTAASQPVWNIGQVDDALLQSGWKAGDLFLAVRNPEKHMRFYTGNAERMILDKDGLLGVGTPSPRHRVTVSDHWELMQMGLGSRFISMNKYWDGVRG